MRPILLLLFFTIQQKLASWNIVDDVIWCLCSAAICAQVKQFHHVWWTWAMYLLYEYSRPVNLPDAHCHSSLTDLDASSFESDIFPHDNAALPSFLSTPPSPCHFSLFIFNLHIAFIPKSILNGPEHKHPVDFRLDEGRRRSISANGMETTDEHMNSSMANGEFLLTLWLQCSIHPRNET